MSKGLTFAVGNRRHPSNVKIYVHLFEKPLLIKTVSSMIPMKPMEKRTFGPRGVAVSVIGQGTWELEKADRRLAIAALRKGLDLGMTHIDTAEMYGSGEVEKIVGTALEGRRDEVFLVSKVLPSNATDTGTLRACEQSLKRLKTDHLDLYLLHWREQTPLEETFRAFGQLLQEGKILSFGVSNFDVSDLEEAMRIDHRIVCNQTLYHLKERAIEHAVLPWCAKNHIPVVAYSPLGAGDFPESPVLEEIARRHHATPRQVALRFLVRHPSVFAIPKAARENHVLENAGAGSLTLSEEEVHRIDLAFPKGLRRTLPMI